MKTFELILLIFVGVSSTLSLVLWYILFGVKDSISSYYYHLKNIKKGWAFRMFIFCITVPIGIIAVIEGMWLLLAAALLESLVGVLPEFRHETTKSEERNKIEEYLHIFGAVSGIVLAMLILYYKFDQKKAGEKWFKWASNAWVQKISNYTYWIELSALVVVYIGLVTVLIY